MRLEEAAKYLIEVTFIDTKLNIDSNSILMDVYKANDLYKNIALFLKKVPFKCLHHVGKIK